MRERARKEKGGKGKERRGEKEERKEGGRGWRKREKAWRVRSGGKGRRSVMKKGGGEGGRGKEEGGK